MSGLTHINENKWIFVQTMEKCYLFTTLEGSVSGVSNATFFSDSGEKPSRCRPLDEGAAGNVDPWFPPSKLWHAKESKTRQDIKTFAIDILFVSSDLIRRCLDK